MTPTHKVQTGALLLCAGSYLLYQGYEGSGRNRPWWLRFLPGS